MRQHVTDYLSDHNISFSAKQTMFWEALYELYRAPLTILVCLVFFCCSTASYNVTCDCSIRIPYISVLLD